MDARQGSNGTDGNFNRIPSNPDVPDDPGIQRVGPDTVRSSDPRLMTVPVGGGSTDLLGTEGPQPAAATTTPVTSEIGAPWSDTAPSGDGPIRCKFLRAIGPDGKLSDPGNEAVPTHRCAAFGDPLPLSLRQQELVCLQRVHVSCPRYMRGTLLAEEAHAGPVAEPKAKLGVPYLTLAGLALLTLACVAGVLGVMGILPGTGGGAAPTTPGIAAASASPTPLVTASVEATASPVATNSPAPTAPPVVTAAPTATPVASATWPPGATADRMKLLTPCQNQANCYVYVVRGPGPSGNGSSVADTVPGIARYFGVSVQSIYNLNPWATSGIKPGDQLKIPPPTR